MARKAPSLETIKALLARSGNQCAFPECNHPIINEKNKFIAQICHIEAANEGGERFNPNQNDEQRRAYENLLFFCYRHHIETNDEEIFTVERLKEIKQNHESEFKESKFRVEEEITLKEIQRDIDKFWIELKGVHEVENTLSWDIKMEIKFDVGINELFANLRQNINHLNGVVSHLHESEDKLDEDFKEIVKTVDFLGIVSRRVNKIAYYKNPLINRNWEYLNLGVPNLTQKISILLDQIEIKILENQVLENHRDRKIKSRLEKLKLSLKEHARNATYCD